MDSDRSPITFFPNTLLSPNVIYGNTRSFRTNSLPNCLNNSDLKRSPRSLLIRQINSSDNRHFSKGFEGVKLRPKSYSKLDLLIEFMNCQNEFFKDKSPEHFVQSSLYRMPQHCRTTPASSFMLWKFHRPSADFRSTSNIENIAWARRSEDSACEETLKDSQIEKWLCTRTGRTEPEARQKGEPKNQACKWNSRPASDWPTKFS